YGRVRLAREGCATACADKARVCGGMSTRLAQRPSRTRNRENERDRLEVGSDRRPKPELCSGRPRHVLLISERKAENVDVRTEPGASDKFGTNHAPIPQDMCNQAES